MSKKKHVVRLALEEREHLNDLVSTGQAAARKMVHARILLKADEGEQGPGWTDGRIMEALDIGHTTVDRVRERFAKEGLEAALSRRKPNREFLRKLDGCQEAQLVRLACAAGPDGRAEWSLRLLAEQMVALEYVDAISHETIRKVLKKTRSSPG